MSPEQATGDQTVGPATDTYALGCVLYEMLVGEPPFTGSSPQAILGKTILGSPESVRDQRPSVPTNVEAAISKALERLPADRFTSALDFAGALTDSPGRYSLVQLSLPRLTEPLGHYRQVWSSALPWRGSRSGQRRLMQPRTHR